MVGSAIKSIFPSFKDRKVMKFLLVNPNWTFEGSIYFGCREPHLPLEFGYSKALLEKEGHEALLLDAQMENLSSAEIRRRAKSFSPDFTVITTAPSYLFWRCAPPELRVPQETLAEIRDIAGTVVVVGPHASTTPGAAIKKLNADIAVRGECEEILPRLAAERDWGEIPPVSFRRDGQVKIQSGPYASDMSRLPALEWPNEFISRHGHHHHRFDASSGGLGAEMEASRGCPYHCVFCAKDNFRNLYRKRPLESMLRELDGLIENGIEYLYFIDEIFLPNRELLEALCLRNIKFGAQLRIDHWNYEMIELLGRAGCVSIEAGVESITPEGRNQLQKNCKLTTEELTARLTFAKKHIPFVQANMIESKHDNPDDVEKWRLFLQDQGVWANKPVPLFPYPGSPNYTMKWGLPDDNAWERAHQYYLEAFREFSDIQEEQPLPLSELETSP
jgi:B12-binding domain/radical SAM domain protein of rhizo-twelve system